MTLTLLDDSLNRAFVQREHEIRALLLGLVAREHVLLVGPPGTGKSQLCRSLAAGVDGARYCERLLAPTTPPEALFGPVSIPSLREGRYEHVGEGSITDAHIVFLDEVFRGSDAILDTLLHILGPERQALVGTKQVRVPLIFAVGASNSWSEAQEQAAIMDRWLIRREVKPVSEKAVRRLLFDDLPGVGPVVSLSEVERLQREAATLPISNEAKEAMLQIVSELNASGIRPSDRRSRKSICVARAAAAMDGAKEVLPRHLASLTDVLWDNQEHVAKCREIISRIADPIGAKLDDFLREADEVLSSAKDTNSRIVAIKKVEQIAAEVGKMAASGNGRANKALEYIVKEKVRLQAEILGIDPKKLGVAQ